MSVAEERSATVAAAVADAGPRMCPRPPRVATAMEGYPSPRSSGGRSARSPKSPAASSFSASTYTAVPATGAGLGDTYAGGALAMMRGGRMYSSLSCRRLSNGRRPSGGNNNINRNRNGGEATLMNPCPSVPSEGSALEDGGERDPNKRRHSDSLTTASSSPDADINVQPLSPEEKARKSVGSILRRLSEERIERERLQRAADDARRGISVEAVDEAEEDQDEGFGGVTVAERIRRQRLSLQGGYGSGSGFGSRSGNSGGFDMGGRLTGEGRPSMALHRRSRSVPRNLTTSSDALAGHRASRMGRGGGVDAPPFDLDDFVVTPPSRSLGHRISGSSSSIGVAASAAAVNSSTASPPNLILSSQFERAASIRIKMMEEDENGGSSEAGRGARERTARPSLAGRRTISAAAGLGTAVKSGSSTAGELANRKDQSEGTGPQDQDRRALLREGWPSAEDQAHPNEGAPMRRNNFSGESIPERWQFCDNENGLGERRSVAAAAERLRRAQNQAPCQGEVAPSSDEALPLRDLPGIEVAGRIEAPTPTQPQQQLPQPKRRQPPPARRLQQTNLGSLGDSIRNLLHLDEEVSASATRTSRSVAHSSSSAPFSSVPRRGLGARSRSAYCLGSDSNREMVRAARQEARRHQAWGSNSNEEQKYKRLAQHDDDAAGECREYLRPQLPEAASRGLTGDQQRSARAEDPCELQRQRQHQQQPSWPHQQPSISDHRQEPNKQTPKARRRESLQEKVKEFLHLDEEVRAAQIRERASDRRKGNLGKNDGFGRSYRRRASEGAIPSPDAAFVPSEQRRRRTIAAERVRDAAAAVTESTAGLEVETTASLDTADVFDEEMIGNNDDDDDNDDDNNSYDVPIDHCGGGGSSSGCGGVSRKDDGVGARQVDGIPRSTFHGSGDNLKLEDSRFKVLDGMIVLASMDGDDGAGCRSRSIGEGSRRRLSRSASISGWKGT